MKVDLDMDLRLETPEDVDKWVRNSADMNKIPNLKDHKDLVSGELVLSTTRLAFVGYTEGKEVMWQNVSGPDMTVRQLVHENFERLGAKHIISLCLPVDRPAVQFPTRSKKKTHGRGDSMPNMAIGRGKKMKDELMRAESDTDPGPQLSGPTVKIEKGKGKEKEKNTLVKTEKAKEKEKEVLVKTEKRQGVKATIDGAEDEDVKDEPGTEDESDSFPDFSDAKGGSEETGEIKTTRGGRVIKKPSKLIV